MILDRYLELARERVVRSGAAKPADVHLAEGLSWICRAQDAGKDRGVSHSYEIGRGWLPSYPETTGYVIPTLLNFWKERGNDDARRRALEMAEWELSVQLPNGSIPDLVAREPVVFDTGQVIFGWVAAFRASEDERYLEAARKAGAWLLDVMDSDGAWRRFTGASAGITFNVRVAWALAELAAAANDGRFREGARKSLEWSLRQEEGRGWFGHNCLTDNDRPLLHTIAYTAQGQLEVGVLLDDSRLIEAARRTAMELATRVQPGGRLAGRYDRSWRPAVRWACLTGMAQISLVWSRLAALTGDRAPREGAERVNRFLMSTHDVTSKNGGLRGGIRGSFPVNGTYCRFRLPNWATKFFLDAILYAPSTGKLPIFKG
jgi:hypothetical protein